MYKLILSTLLENAINDSPEIARIKDKYNYRINLANRNRDITIQNIKTQEKMEIERAKRRIKAFQSTQQQPMLQQNIQPIRQFDSNIQQAPIGSMMGFEATIKPTDTLGTILEDINKSINKIIK